jgi:hypothetical protein
MYHALLPKLYSGPATPLRSTASRAHFTAPASPLPTSHISSSESVDPIAGQLGLRRVACHRAHLDQLASRSAAVWCNVADRARLVARGDDVVVCVPEAQHLVPSPAFGYVSTASHEFVLARICSRELN